MENKKIFIKNRQIRNSSWRMENQNVPEGWKIRKIFLKDGKLEKVPKGWKFENQKIFL